MIVVSYARYSTDRQTEASILDQQRVCRERAAREGWTLAHEFTDEGISGAALGNRPGVQAALAALANGGVLLLADTTRLSRSQELAPLIDRLRFRGVRVIGVLDGFDSSSAHARMQAGLSGLMSDELRANIRARTHSALQMRAREARPTGGRAYGFDKDGAVVEAEAAIVREVFARAAAGEGLKAIASDLNVRGVPSPGSTWNREKRRKDGRWLISTLHAMLGNERYIGRVVWNRSVWVKNPDTGVRERRERPREEWVVREGPALIEPAVFETLAARSAARTAAYGSAKGTVPRYLLSGLLVCRGCGQRLIAVGNRGSHYYCGSHRHGGPAACEMAKGVRRDIAERVILAPVRDELLSPAAVRHAVELIRGWAKSDRQATDVVPGLDAIDAEIAELQALMAARPALSGALMPALEAAQGRRIAAQRAAWRRAAGVTHDDNAAARAYVEAAERFREVLEGGQVVVARDALRGILGDVPIWQAGGVMWARVGVNPQPLLASAGIFASSGSGGVLWTQAKRDLQLVA